MKISFKGINQTQKDGNEVKSLENKCGDFGDGKANIHNGEFDKHDRKPPKEEKSHEMK